MGRINFLFPVAIIALLLSVLYGVSGTSAQSGGSSLWTTNGPAPGGAGSQSVEVGLKFRSSVAGYIIAIKFWKNSNELPSTHIGNLWTSSGTLLGSVVFSGETASGWQQATLATPVNIAANVDYIVSYHTVGFSVTQGSAWPRIVGPLTGIGSVFAYGNGPSLFPNQPMYMNSNYWVDLVLTSGTQPTATPTPQGTQVPTITPVPTATPAPTAFNCTEVLGFSVTESWYNGGFIQAVTDPTKWQLRWFSGGGIDLWGAGSAFPGWFDPQYLTQPHCTNGGVPDRFVIQASSVYRDDPGWWATHTQLTINYIRQVYSPGVRSIVLVPNTGGPGGALCPTSDPLASYGVVRATYNYQYIMAGYQTLVNSVVSVGPGLQVESCADYADWAGHITIPARQRIGNIMAQYFGAAAPPTPTPVPNATATVVPTSTATPTVTVIPTATVVPSGCQVHVVINGVEGLIQKDPSFCNG